MQQFLLDNFQRYNKRGMDAYRNGDMVTARVSLLKASELLFKLAAESSGELRKVRKDKATKLLELAKSIDPSAPASREVPTASGRTAAREDDDKKPDGEQWIVSTVPDVSFEDIAGLEDVKATLRNRVIYPFQHPEITRRYRKQVGGGVLLYGPPGTGKTMVAKAIANEVDATFFSIKCSDIMSKWVGEAERNLKTLFETARQHPRAVIFFDETEAIVARRGGDSTVMNRVIPEFLAQVDGVQGKHEGLLLLGATNRPWDMDEAALRPGRFGELIYVPLPDVLARRAIIAATLQGIPMAEDVDFDVVAAETEGLSGADLVGLCEMAKDGPFEREITSQSPQRLEVSDIDAARRRLRPSVTPALLSRYDRYRNGLT